MEKTNCMLYTGTRPRELASTRTSVLIYDSASSTTPIKWWGAVRAICVLHWKTPCVGIAVVVVEACRARGTLPGKNRSSRCREFFCSRGLAAAREQGYQIKMDKKALPSEEPAPRTPPDRRRAYKNVVIGLVNARLSGSERGRFCFCFPGAGSTYPRSIFLPRAICCCTPPPPPPSTICGDIHQVSAFTERTQAHTMYILHADLASSNDDRTTSRNRVKRTTTPVTQS